MKYKYTREIRVGAVIVVALAIIIGFVFTLGGNGEFFSSKLNYKILFKSTAGLYEGDPVLLTGVEVGNVTKIGFPEDLKQKKILVEITVDRSVGDRIREDTRACVGSASIVYGKVVELSIGSLDQHVIPDGGWIKTMEKSSFNSVVDSTQQVMGSIQNVIAKINQGEGMLGMLLNEPMELKKTLHHLSVSTEKLSSILDKLDRGKGPMGSVLSDSVEFSNTLHELKMTVTDLKNVSQSLRSDKTVLGRLISDETYGKTVTQDLQKTLHALANITTKIDTGEGSAGMLINDPELYIGLQDVVLGVQKSKLTRWLVQNRRKAGEKAREEQANGE
ncbi:MCE family protein [bacterium]|nr:MCE family protein [bacterium]